MTEGSSEVGIRGAFPYAPVTMVLGSMTSLQFGAAIATHLFHQVGAAGASALRLGLAAVILVAWARPSVRSWSAGERRSVLLLGGAMACMNTAFYEAVSRLPLGAAITIEFLGPLGLAAVLTRRRREATWVLVALGGVVILGLGQHGEGSLHALDPLGIVFALVAAFFWACYIVTGSRLATTGPTEGGLAGACTVAAILVVPYGLAVSGRELGHAHVLLLGLAMATLASVVPYSLELRALRTLAKRTFSILTALEPAIGTLVGFACSTRTSSPSRSSGWPWSWPPASAPPRRPPTTNPSCSRIPRRTSPRSGLLRCATVDIDDFQATIARTYGERDAARGQAATVAWLCEELGELAQAVRKGTAAEQRHELSDVLAWLASLAHQLGLSLDDAAQRYVDGCPRCGTVPCSCP